MLTRRSFLTVGAATVASTLLPRGTVAVQDGQTVRSQWVPVGTAPIVTWQPAGAGVGVGELELYHPTLLPLRRLTGRSTDPVWALWIWHHDNAPSGSVSHLHRWSADRPEGPYRLDAPVALPGGLPAGYKPNHLAQGDIVWDPIGRRLVSTPHSEHLSRDDGSWNPNQDSFLLQSTDGGMTWSFLDGDNRPRLVTSTAASDIHATHTGNGRLLRDLDGELATYEGRYWWAFRAQRHEESMPEELPAICTPAVTSATSLAGAWSTPRALFTTALADTSTWAASSFVLAGGVPSIHYTLPVAAAAGTTEWLSTGGAGMTFTGPGAPMVVPADGPDSFFATGANIVRDRVTSVQYLVVCGLVYDDANPVAYQAKGSAVRLYRSAL